MADIHSLSDPDQGAPPAGEERAPLRRPRVLMPEEPPPLPPAAAAVLLRILRRNGDQERDRDQPAIEEERRAA